MLPSPMRLTMPVMDGDGGADKVALRRPQPCQNVILVGASKPAATDHIRAQDRCKFRVSLIAPLTAIKPSTTLADFLEGGFPSVDSSDS
jgi:hypothetical protein